MAEKLIIAIDGGAGTGTSSAAKGVAKALDIPHLNTGELYRGITFAVLAGHGDITSAADCLRAATAIDFGLEEGNVVTVNGQDVRGKLHEEQVNKLVATVAGYPEVRDRLVAFQREYAADHGAVMEGRDIGTRIFPDTPHKFFFICAPEERVRRVNAGGRVHETAELLAARDAADEAHAVGAFKKAEDAIILDTTDLDVAGVVAAVVAAVHARTTNRV